MAIINQLANTANIIVDGETVTSNNVSTLLQLPPTILKAVDKLTAKINDTLTYTITITNVALSEVTNVLFEDTIPAGATYIVNTFKVNGVEATPIIDNQKLSYTIPTIAVAGITILTFDVTVVGGEA